ncbi:hypothetical protein FLL45_13860 [Aliikangiella marina]|uniref:DUF805 domain-containing protein n=1 Tax=Aliikangiella marina TaxID=1712262 RepID=A0A545T9R1_9GAMM|nr:hypothetical protein [Aliikangiella marina]TQV73944.1 hypothetical protein FLL45_13860 [Aliikangiella marina]
MLLIKSLLCLRGFDNGRRFLAVSLGCYGLFILLSPVLLKAPVLLVLLLLCVTPILTASSMRRIHDAGFATPYAVIPTLVYWLSVLGITFIEHGAAYALLILSILVTLAMTTISNARVRRDRQYYLGYHGPVFDEESREKAAERRFYDRIEPTLAAGHASAEESVNSANNNIEGRQSPPSQSIEPDLAATNRFHSAHYAPTNQSSFEQKLGDWFLANKMLSIGSALAVMTILVVFLAWPEEPSDERQTEESVVQTQSVRERLHKIKMPDNFWIMLDQNESLTVAWQGDIMKDGELWSAVTGKGDRSCFELRFNGGDSYRTMQVEVKNQGDYYADFSPVDTRVMLEGIAKKSRFTLCGFEFSLKGTQAIMMSNKAYFDILTEE